ncbi:MAG: metallophosphoesterase [Candidatus Bipolaricaulaceae bacterium]
MHNRAHMPAVVLVLLAALAAPAAAARPPDAIPARITRWVDGDTGDVHLLVRAPDLGPRERVRLLGIDAPELDEPLGQQARRHLRQLTMGKTVYLEFDRQRRDVHGRPLVHVWVASDGDWLLVGEEMLLAGLARTLFIPPNARYLDRFQRAERLAQARCLGLWEAACHVLELPQLEADPVPHVTEPVGVRFLLGRWEQGRDGRWILWAAGSRYGFHVLLPPQLWDDLAETLVTATGLSVVVRGVLSWTGSAGPSVAVDIREQLTIPPRWPQSPFVHGPYSQAPTTTGVTVSWTAERPLPGRVEYGPWSEFMATGVLPRAAAHQPAVSSGRESAHVRLPDLEPGTRYAYRVVLAAEGGEWASPVGAFRTAPARDEPVSFAVIADTQWQWEGTNRIRLVGDAVAADPAPWDFVLHGGDLVESPIPRYWDHTLSSLSAVLLRAPFLPVLGNHERGSRSYYELFTLPAGGGRDEDQWWALEFGDVVVVGLDSNVSRPDHYTAQVEFLRESLSGDQTHRFVILHHPVYSSDAMYGPGSAGLQHLFHPVFVELGVDVVFSGHAHNYERIQRDGVTYLVVGGGGATPRPLAEDRLPGSLTGVNGRHFYVRVNTSPQGMVVEAVGVAQVVGGEPVAKHEVLDRFTLPATP